MRAKLRIFMMSYFGLCDYPNEKSRMRVLLSLFYLKIDAAGGKEVQHSLYDY